MSVRKPKVLFLCTGNSARSQMAEAFLRKYAGEHFEAHSAGLEPSGINPLTIEVMKEKGISLEGQRSKDVSEYMGKVVLAYVIIVCANAEKRCPAVFPGAAKREFWPFDDPAAVEGTKEEKLAAFRRVRDEIEQRILKWLEESV
ncbi:MAG: arsenate reductase ArsC [Planctomycetota bacterium]